VEIEPLLLKIISVENIAVQNDLKKSVAVISVRMAKKYNVYMDYE